MFRDEPSDVCSQYTSRNNPLRAFGDALADAMEDMPELRDALIASGAVMPNAKVSGAGTASAGLPGWQANGETE